MTWTIEYTETALRQLSKLDKPMARRIIDYMESQIATAENPRNFGKPLKGHLGEFWRYRIGDFPVISSIQDSTLSILVVKVGHRKNIYP